MGNLTGKCEGSVEETKAEVNAALEKIIPDRNLTGEAARYVLLAPGHRWRPLLTMTLAEAFDNPYPVTQLACASECIHAASIIQDDKPCMDDARLRRGRPTCHVEYGEDIADLAKIRLIIAAYETVTQHAPDGHRKMLLTESNRVGVKMLDGQESDLRKGLPTEEDILGMYVGKSGELIAFAAISGLFHLSDAQWPIARIYRFGYELGTAYQIADDIQDAVLTADQIGKDVGQDGGKPSIVNLTDIASARQKAQGYKANALCFVSGKPDVEQLLDRMVQIN